MLTAARFWPKHLWFMLPIFILVAALKEFWYDKNYELPKQTTADNTLDFLMYFTGLVIGSLVILVN
jgi:hypothetical protein